MSARNYAIGQRLGPRGVGLWVFEMPDGTSEFRTDEEMQMNVDDPGLKRATITFGDRAGDAGTGAVMTGPNEKGDQIGVAIASASRDSMGRNTPRFILGQVNLDEEAAIQLAQSLQEHAARLQQRRVEEEERKRKYEEEPFYYAVTVLVPAANVYHHNHAANRVNKAIDEYEIRAGRYAQSGSVKGATQVKTITRKMYAEGDWK